MSVTPVIEIIAPRNFGEDDMLPSSIIQDKFLHDFEIVIFCEGRLMKFFFLPQLVL